MVRSIHLSYLAFSQAIFFTGLLLPVSSNMLLIGHASICFPNSDTDKAKKKWRNLRDKFVKKRRIQGNTTPSNSEDDHQWEYYHRLLFLDEHVNRRR